MQNLEWYLADLESTGKNTIETVEKSLTDMFIRLVRIYSCLSVPFLHFYHNLYYSGNTELDTYVGIHCLQCQEMCNPYKQDVDLMLVYCWVIVCDAVPILNQYLICVSYLQDRYIE